MNIAIVGSRKWDNKIKIKDFIYGLKKKYGDDITIVSGGCKNGADRFAKKYALEFDMDYVEFPPSHEQYNMYCVLPQYRYGKPYATWHYFERNHKIAEYSDIIVGFIPEGHKSNGTMSTMSHAEKLNKKTLIIN